MPRPLDAQLEAIGQSHLLRFADELTPEERSALTSQIKSLDLELVPTLIQDYVLRKPAINLPELIEPATYYPSDPESSLRPWDRSRFLAEGEDLIRQGQIAAFTVAGGQGTRLGFDGPKGCYPAGPITGNSLFQVFAEQILSTRRKYDARIPWYIMTSPLNHDETMAYFAENDYFGLEGNTVHMFPQGVMPSFDAATGRILLAEKGQIATNPDGHGGSLRALARSGALDEMAEQGIRHISYFQVDNPLVRAVDPVFIGLHACADDSSAEMSSKMIPKAYPEEKLGMLCRIDGKTLVVEYSDLPMDRQRETTPDGSLRFLAGSIAIHVLGVEFVRRINEGGRAALPLHRADKKVPFVDPRTGQRIDPDRPNAVKLEMFVFDALALCGNSIVYETTRAEEFAPIKNAEGPDSAATCRDMQVARAAAWLEAAGVSIPRKPDGSPDCLIELSPLTALEPGELLDRDLPRAIGPGARILL